MLTIDTENINNFMLESRCNRVQASITSLTLRRNTIISSNSPKLFAQCVDTDLIVWCKRHYLSLDLIYPHTGLQSLGTKDANIFTPKSKSNVGTEQLIKLIINSAIHTVNSFVNLYIYPLQHLMRTFIGLVSTYSLIA